MSLRPFQARGARAVGAALAAAVATLLATVAPAMGATAPDGRGYELVTPVDKFGSVPNYPVGPTAGLGFVFLNAITAASENGEQLVWDSIGALPGTGNGIPMSYRSFRTGQGWVTTQASPNPVSEHPNVLLSRAMIRDVVPDFSRRIITSNEEFDPLIQGGLGGALKLNLFTQDSQGNLTWVSRPNGGPSTALFNVQYEGRDATASHVLFGTFEELVPAAVGQFGRGLFDHSGGQTVLVNVDNGGNPVHPCGAVLGTIPSFDGTEDRILQGAVSRDGSRIAFTAPDPNGFDGSCADPATVYVRVNGTTTAVASASQRTVADPLGTRPAIFQGAVDGGGVDKVYFRSDEALTDDAQDGTAGSFLLYEYDVPSEALTLLTPNDIVLPEVLGIVGMAEDGSRLYVMARGVLDPAAPADLAAKLYGYADGDFTYIGSVPDGEVTELTSGEAARPVRVTPDGDRILLVTSADMRSFTTAGHRQVYLYDASDDTVFCVSCPGGTGTPTADAHLSADDAPNVRPATPRNLVDGGRRVFFDTADALVTRDDNQVVDVYEWDAGAVSLISGGRGSDPSFFADSGNNGADVFFVTKDQLVGQDTNADTDFYDARIGGGFPAPAPDVVPCLDDQCQGQPTSSPTLPGAASMGDFGGGNVSSSGKRTLTIGTVSAKARRAFAQTGRLTLRLRVGEAGPVRVVARARFDGKQRVVARANRRLSRAGAARVTLTLSRVARNQLAQAGRLTARIAVAFPGASTRTTTLVLVQPKRTDR